MDSHELQKQYIQIVEIPEFELVFPNLISQIQQIISSQISFVTKLFGMYPQQFKKVCKQIEGKIIQWSWLKKQSNNKVVYHVYKMLFSLVNDEEFKNLSQVDQNILLWATLLHDICKIGEPTIKGKDHCHPFKSGYETLKILNQLNFINLTEHQLQEWEFIFSQGYHPCKEEKGKFIHNNQIVIQVKQFLDQIYGNSLINPQKEVILLIFLHQSLSLIKEYPPKTPLEDNYYKLLLSDRFLDLFYFIAVHDSRSYKMCKPLNLTFKFSNLQKEVKSSVQALKELIKEK